MITLEQKIEKYRNIELAANTVLHGSSILSIEQKTHYRKIFHEARIKRMKIQLQAIDKMEIYNKNNDARKGTTALFVKNHNNDDVEDALGEATNCLHGDS